ncbi:MAG: leucyl-tRNA synthetase [Thermoproteota archaeon]|nr:leucyl-tRNA synthetase [Thermoproteota archaeon]
MRLSLDWQAVEKKWQSAWKKARIFEADPSVEKKKFFLTVAYPYPNSPQHVGHGRTYTLTDVYARFKRMQGYNVLFPMAFHYTGTPVLAIAKRVASGDKELLEDFTKIYKVPTEELKAFVEPVKIADYFHNEIREGMREIGFSIDWRREFTTIDAAYSRFVEWQFRKLQSKGLITRGSHPVGWCQDCGSPMGQHDTKGDVEPEIGELTLIKFKLDEVYLPTATLRPETVFGVTNVWVRPDVEYVRVAVDDEVWIVSEECADKLLLLEHKVSLLGRVAGRELVGKYLDNPLTGGKVPILPASFVDPKNATGVVMSVPAHAPYDYIALEDLKADESRLLEFNLEPKVVRGIRPVSLISLEGYSEFPAVDAVVRFKVKGQMDEKAEEATKEVYSQEFRNGRMRDNTDGYAGMRVSEAKDRVKEDLIRAGKAAVMYELLNRPVYCRCGGEAAVKIFKDQWFINYGDEAWKERVRDCLADMRILPEDLRVEFENVISWLREKACARRQGLGTRLPWDNEWIIESLSDSVIYMSYYTISKHINAGLVDVGKLDDEVFDFVFLGLGDPNVIGAGRGLAPLVLREMRDEFCYFYPLDSRNSGRDLVPNHLTYFIFNHVAIFPESLWPRQIVVSGSVLMEGKKMSKSFGNIIPLRDALRSFGADGFRLAILATAELLQDADFSSSLARSLKERLERFYAFALEVIDAAEREGGDETVGSSMAESWLMSRLMLRVKAVTSAMEEIRFREAIHNVLFMLDQDVQWYLKRSVSGGGKGSSRVLRRVLETRVLLLTPFAPHLCEEVWERLGNAPFVSLRAWPEFRVELVDAGVIEGEELVRDLRDDVAKIVQATRSVPKRVVVYVAAGWKWRVYLEVLREATAGEARIGDVMKVVMVDAELRSLGRRVASFVQKVVSDVNKMPREMVGSRLGVGVLDVAGILGDARGFFEREFNAEVVVHGEDDAGRYDPRGRAGLAEPYRPAVFLE